MLTARLLLLVFTLSMGCATTPKRTVTDPVPSAPAKLSARERLSPAMREMLTLRMSRHGDRMLLLFESVLLLNYPLSAVLAREIVAEPKLGRPAAGEQGTLNALLPAAFFEYQDQLVASARVLADAASAREHEALSAAFGRVTETCVDCHAAYLYDDDAETATATELWMQGADVADEP